MMKDDIFCRKLDLHILTAAVVLDEACTVKKYLLIYDIPVSEGCQDHNILQNSLFVILTSQ